MTTTHPTDTSSARGFLLVFLMVGTFFIATLTAAAAHLVVADYSTSYAERYRVNTQLAVDAAVSQALTELNNDSNWTGTGSEVTLLDQDNVKTTYTTQVVTNSPDSKTINVTSNVYRPSSATQPLQTRSVEVGVAEATSSQPLDGYSVATGQGGLYMYALSEIHDGDVYVGGILKMYSNAKIGSWFSGTKLYVANQMNIPGQPITLNANAQIYGEVRATGQTNGNDMMYPGLIAGESAPVLPLPDHDRSAITSDVSTTWNGSTASCNGSDVMVWPDGLKVNGDVSVSSSCSVTVMGDVWITGDLSVTNSAKMSVATGLAQPPTIMIDGDDGFVGDGLGELKTNGSGVGMKIITYYANAPCNPGCTDVTGAALTSSANHTTINTDGNFAALGSEFYARWSRLVLGGNVQAGALVGQTIVLSSNGSILLDGEVSDFVAESGSGWRMSSYNRVYE